MDSSGLERFVASHAIWETNVWLEVSSHTLIGLSHVKTYTNPVNRLRLCFREHFIICNKSYLEDTWLIQSSTICYNPC